MGQSSTETQTAAESRIESIVDGLEQERVPNLSERDRETLLEFHREMLILKAAEGRFQDHYHGELLWYMQQFGIEVGSVTVTLEDSEAGENAVNDCLTWLEDQDLADTTKASALSALRVFADVMLETSPGDFDEDELPDRFKKISPKKHITDKDPSPLPSNVINWEDAIQMAKTRSHVRDKALILFQLGAGLRPMAELHKLKFKHVHDKGDHFVISTPEGAKTGRREVHVYAGSAMLRKWIEELHPAHLETERGPGPETVLWTHYDENRPIVYGTMASVFRRAGDKAEIEKSHSPQHFRRSAASFAASKPTIGERELREQFGWSRFSTAPDHYITAFSERVSIHFAEAYGHEIEDVGGAKLAPIGCTSCEQWTTRHLESCIWCSHEIDPEDQDLTHTIPDPDAPEKELHKMILDGDVTPDDLRSVAKLENKIQTDNSFFDDLDRLIMMAEGLEDDQSGTTHAVMGALGIGTIASKAAAKWARTKDRFLRAHPEFEHYPLRGRRLVGFVAGLSLLFATAGVLLAQNGTLEALAAGDIAQWTALLIAAAMSGVLFDRMLPDREETVSMLLEEMQTE